MSLNFESDEKEPRSVDSIQYPSEQYLFEILPRQLKEDFKEKFKQKYDENSQITPEIRAWLRQEFDKIDCETLGVEHKKRQSVIDDLAKQPEEILKALQDYFSSPPSKDAFTDDDCNKVLAAPETPFLLIEAFIVGLQKECSPENLEKLKKLVKIGIDKLLYAGENNVPKIQEEFRKRFKSLDRLPDDTETLIAMCKFLVENRIPFPKPNPKLKLDSLLDGTPLSNLKHLAMINRAFYGYYNKKGYGVVTADDSMYEHVKYFTEFYDISNLSLNDMDILLLVPTFLESQFDLINLSSNGFFYFHLSEMLAVSIFHLNQKLESFLKSNSIDLEKQHVFDLLKFRAKLKLFQRQFSNEYYNDLIEDILKVTSFEPHMKIDVIQRELTEKCKQPIMLQLLEHLKEFNSSRMLYSSLEDELYQQACVKKQENTEAQKIKADFCFTNPLAAPCLSERYKNLQYQALIKRVSQLEQKRKVLDDILSNSQIGLEAKVNQIKQSYLFNNDHLSDFVSKLYEFDTKNSEKTSINEEDFNALLEIMTREDLFPPEKVQLGKQFLKNEKYKTFCDTLFSNSNNSEPVISDTCNQQLLGAIEELKANLLKVLKNPKISAEDKRFLQNLYDFFEGNDLNTIILELSDFLVDNKVILTLSRKEESPTPLLKYLSFILILPIFYYLVTWLVNNHQSLPAQEFIAISEKVLALNQLIVQELESSINNENVLKGSN